MPKYTLTYWDIQGKAEAIRLAFQIAKIPFTDNRISREEFLKLKQEDAFKFSQIPALDIDGVQFAQSKSILRYIGKQSNLYPKSDYDQLIVDEGIDFVDDIWLKVANAVIFTKGEQEIIEAKKNLQNQILPRMLSYYDQIVLKNQSGFYWEKQLSVVDLVIYVLIQWITGGEIDNFSYDLNQHQGLVQLKNKIDAIPEVQEWNSKHN